MGSELETRAAAAGAVAKAPRVTLAQLQSLIERERFFTDDTLTICVLTLKNGFKVTGESAAADEANFNEELGRKIARDKAFAEIWPLAGFLLREELHRGQHSRVMRMKLSLSSRLPQKAYAGRDTAGQELYSEDGELLSFSAVWESPAKGSADNGNACRENRIFTDMTPWVEFRAVVRNKTVLSHLGAPGGQFYVDFIPAPVA